MIQDTIAAVATPFAPGGIGIIRASGPGVEDIARRLFRPTKGRPCPFNSHHLYLGDIICPDTGAILDEALVTIMRSPRSYTGEDTLEIQAHGGLLVMQQILRTVLKAGARLAEPGEFTRRAFLNNRIDLSQAEAIAEIISARSEGGLEIALARLKGDMADLSRGLRDEVIELLGILETSIDFEESELDREDQSNPKEKIQSLEVRISELLATYQRGRMLAAGISVVIIGRPNVGKSSLLNALLGKKRAIVTAIPGTTRDLIEDTLAIGDLTMLVVDTAGIREGADLIEREGIDLLRDRLSTADLAVVVVDGSDEPQQEDLEIIAGNLHLPLVVFLNKSDLPQKLQSERFTTLGPGIVCIQGSAKLNHGITELKEAIYGLVNQEKREARSSVMVTNLRHKLALEKAAVFLQQARIALEEGISPELILLDLREAADALGEITGKILCEDVLDRIFSTFCVGK
ncbi:MAG: tRNA uridine-5-carboxymethylaminomethyl(34) synthesis GTPase MnmE [Smithellaceae bacterium]|nr:tRNA uridine-5-carboxymethylaminomethyl(34) synthesis GTPase MnmE [Smithellaceae bacterium]